MFGNKIKFSATPEQVDELRQRYRLLGKSDKEVVQTVFDQVISDPNFHTKALPKKRTDSDEDVQQ